MVLDGRVPYSRFLGRNIRRRLRPHMGRILNVIIGRTSITTHNRVVDHTGLIDIDATTAAVTPTAIDYIHPPVIVVRDRKSTRLNSSHANISYAVFCLKKKNTRRYLTSPHISLSIPHLPAPVHPLYLST